MDLEELLKKMNDGRQFRNIVTMRAVSDESEDKKEYRVTGMATTFNQPYTLYEYKNWDGVDVEIREQIDSHAFDDCDMKDVIFQLNHEGRVYARTRNKTLLLSIEEEGLGIDAYLGGTKSGREIHEEIEKGYLDRMSFAFIVAEDKLEEFTEGEKRVIVRTVTKVSKLYDVSVVSVPANDHTSISARSYCDGVIAELEAERLRAEKEEEQKRQAVILAEARKRELDLLELSFK